MKASFITILVSLFTITVTAQTQHEEIERRAVERTVLNYIENFFENNFDAMNKSLHPRLVKRGLNQKDITLSEDVPPKKLKELMSTKSKFALKRQNNTVESISIFGNMASAALITGYPTVRWVEYIHLVKLNGDWKIINIFWEFKRIKRQG